MYCLKDLKCLSVHTVNYSGTDCFFLYFDDDFMPNKYIFSQWSIQNKSKLQPHNLCKTCAARNGVCRLIFPQKYLFLFSNHTPNTADDEFWIFKYYSFLFCYFKRFPIDITNLYRKSSSNKKPTEFYSVFGSPFFIHCCFLCNFLVMTKILLMSFESCNDVQQTNIKFFTRFLLLVCCLLWNCK